MVFTSSIGIGGHNGEFGHGAQGLRPIQIWVPDVWASEFIAEAHRQPALIAASKHEGDDQAFVDAISTDGHDGAEPAE